MVKNKTVGLPEDFKLNINKPVQLGDYLDETSEPTPSSIKLRRPQNTIQPQIDPEPTISLETQYQEPEVLPKKSTPVVQLRAKEEQAQELSPRKKIKPPKRKQINMSPQTLEHFAELVTYVQEYSQQPDAAASEVMDAIISAHHDAMAQLRLGSVPPRGRWGSPTAQAFKDALSKAFTQALIDYHSNTRAKISSAG